MKKMQKTLISAFVFLFALFIMTDKVMADRDAEALLLMPGEEMEDYASFSKELETGGARIIEAYSTNIFRGYIPKELEDNLKKKYGAKVYRGIITYMGDFAVFGEKGMLAAAKWNKYMQEDPDDAPMIINTFSQRAGKKGKYLKLCWNKVPDAFMYRLEISRGESFENVSFDTATKDNCHIILPDFWPDGVHYWRVAPVFRTVKKEIKEGEFSEPANFAVSKQSSKKKKSRPKKPLIPAENLNGRNITWAPGGQPYYRAQFSETDNFDVPLADVFTDTCSYRLSYLNLKHGRKYFFRIQASDGEQTSPWSDSSEFIYNSRPTYKKNI